MKRKFFDTIIIDYSKTAKLVNNILYISKSYLEEVVLEPKSETTVEYSITRNGDIITRVNYFVTIKISRYSEIQRQFARALIKTNSIPWQIKKPFYGTYEYHCILKFFNKYPGLLRCIGTRIIMYSSNKNVYF